MSGVGKSRHGVSNAGGTHGVSVEGLEVEALVRDADVPGVGHQRQDHLRGALHVRAL